MFGEASENHMEKYSLYEHTFYTLQTQTLYLTNTHFIPYKHTLYTLQTHFIPYKHTLYTLKTHSLYLIKHTLYS